MQTCRFNFNIIHRNIYVNILLITLVNKTNSKLHRNHMIHIRTQLGLRKPDLVAYINDIVYFIDIQMSTYTIDIYTKDRRNTNYSFPIGKVT